MSVCNIFKQPAGDQDSVFYTFSEYSNSLAGVIAADGQVSSTPSAFIALDLPSSSFVSVGQWMQNYYDDLCCRMRDTSASDRSYLRWELPALLGKLESSDLSTLTSTTAYRGDIDIISNERIDGMDWCECICWMGPDAKRNITFTQTEDTKTIHRDPSDTYISGYSSDTARGSGVSQWGYDTMVAETEVLHGYSIDSITPDKSETSFRFNCVIVLFDLTVGDTVWKDIPMGVYLTRESTVKKCSDETIYGQGTSWSLKVGMRWANTIDGAAVGVAAPDDSYGSFLRCIDRLNDTIDNMNEMTSAFNKLYNGVRDMIYTDSAMKTNSVYWKQFNNKSNNKINVK